MGCLLGRARSDRRGLGPTGPAPQLSPGVPILKAPAAHAGQRDGWRATRRSPAEQRAHLGAEAGDVDVEADPPPAPGDVARRAELVGVDAGAGEGQLAEVDDARAPP